MNDDINNNNNINNSNFCTMKKYPDQIATRLPGLDQSDISGEQCSLAINQFHECGRSWRLVANWQWIITHTERCYILLR